MDIRAKTRAELLVEDLAKSKEFGRQIKSDEDKILKMLVTTLLQGKKGGYNWL
jgi:hypothetical protein